MLHRRRDPIVSGREYPMSEEQPTSTVRYKLVGDCFVCDVSLGATVYWEEIDAEDIVLICCEIRYRHRGRVGASCSEVSERRRLNPQEPCSGYEPIMVGQFHAVGLRVFESHIAFPPRL